MNTKLFSDAMNEIDSKYYEEAMTELQLDRLHLKWWKLHKAAACFAAVMLITNTFSITMAVFDVAQRVIDSSAGIISGSTAVDGSALESMEATLQGMDLGPLLGLFLQSFILQVTMSALAVVIFVIVYGRMIEIYRASRSAAFHPQAVRGHFGNPALASR